MLQIKMLYRLRDQAIKVIHCGTLIANSHIQKKMNFHRGKINEKNDDGDFVGMGITNADCANSNGSHNKCW